MSSELVTIASVPSTSSNVTEPTYPLEVLQSTRTRTLNRGQLTLAIRGGEAFPSRQGWETSHGNPPCDVAAQGRPSAILAGIAFCATWCHVDCISRFSGECKWSSMDTAQTEVKAAIATRVGLRSTRTIFATTHRQRSLSDVSSNVTCPIFVCPFASRPFDISSHLSSLTLPYLPRSFHLCLQRVRDNDFCLQHTASLDFSILEVSSCQLHQFKQL